MAWFWDAYLPDVDRRGEITASPLRASLDDLAGLPEAFVVVDENDVLRDDELVQRVLAARGDPRQVVTDPDVRYFGTRLADGSLVPQDEAVLGATHVEDWLARPIDVR